MWYGNKATTCKYGSISGKDRIIGSVLQSLPYEISKAGKSRI